MNLFSFVALAPTWARAGADSGPPAVVGNPRDRHRPADNQEGVAVVVTHVATPSAFATQTTRS